MISAVKLAPNSDGSFPELDGRHVKTHERGFTIARVTEPSGSQVVAIVVPLDGGTEGVIVKMSLKNFLAAADALRGAVAVGQPDPVSGVPLLDGEVG